jgi:hypothetical protein
MAAMVSNIVLVGYVQMVSKENYTGSINMHYGMHTGNQFERCNSCAKFILFFLGLSMLVSVASSRRLLVLWWWRLSTKQ